MTDMGDSDEEDFNQATNVASESTEAEREFDKILTAIRAADGLKLYADVYTKLYDSYYGKKDELKRAQEDIDVMKSKAARFDSTITSYAEDINDKNKTIDQLRLDIAEARAMADAMHARELAAVETMETMRKTMARLEKELDARKRAGDDDAGATSAAKEKERFEKEKARLQGEADTLRLRLANAQLYVDEMEARAAASEEAVAKLEEGLEEAGNNAVRTGRLVDHLKAEASSLKKELETRVHLITTLNEKASKLEKSVERRDRQLRDAAARLQSARAEQDAAQARAAAAEEALAAARASLDATKQAFAHASLELKNSILDGTRLRAEICKLQKSATQQLKKYQMLEHSKASVESERENLRQQVSVMEREIMLGNKQGEADRREVENLNREKDILNRSIQKIQTEAAENLRTITLQEQRRKQLEHELEMNGQQINRQRLVIRQLDKDKDRMLEETIALNEKIDEITEEVRLRTGDILDLKKALRDEEQRARKCSVTLDASRAERNMLHKNYTEALDEIQDLKQKLKMLAYQIEQLKEDISGKEVGLKSCEGSLAKSHKRVEQLRAEVQGLNAKLADSRAELTALRQEEARLNRIVQESDAARAKLLKELEGLMSERDVVGAQLVRRNDEIALLYEKIRILEITLQRGERQYEQRVEDVRLLRLEVLRLRKEKNLLARGIENMTDLRLEVFGLERELGRERIRTRALEEALETPLNVHRWRKLQGTDPASVELAQKLRMTQKKVLAQSEALVLKDRELKETLNLYKAVKDMLALQPSPDIQQTLGKTQRALTQRTTKIKCLLAELNMREKQVTDLRLELDRAYQELQGFKQRYYELKKIYDTDEQRRVKLPAIADAVEVPAHDE